MGGLRTICGGQSLNPLNIGLRIIFRKWGGLRLHIRSRLPRLDLDLGNGLVVFPAAAGTDHKTMRTAEDVKLNAHRTHRWRDKHFGMVSLITQPINQLLRPEIALASVLQCSAVSVICVG